MGSEDYPPNAVIHDLAIQHFKRLIVLSPTAVLRDLLAHVGTELRLRGHADAANYCAKAVAVLEG